MQTAGFWGWDSKPYGCSVGSLTPCWLWSTTWGSFRVWKESLFEGWLKRLVGAGMMLSLARGKEARSVSRIYRVCIGLTKSCLLNSKECVPSCCGRGTDFCSPAQLRSAMLRSFVPSPYLFSVWPDRQKSITNKRIYLVVSDNTFWFPNFCSLDFAGTQQLITWKPRSQRNI